MYEEDNPVPDDGNDPEAVELTSSDPGYLEAVKSLPPVPQPAVEYRVKTDWSDWTVPC